MPNTSLINSKYFASRDIKVYPAAFRGNYTIITDGTHEQQYTFDPESRMPSEYNSIHTGNMLGNLNSYIVNWDATQSILKCVVDGYYFEIANVILTDFVKNGQPRYLAITKKEITLIDGNEHESTRKTYVLRSFEENAENLDLEISSQWAFTGLAVLDSDTGNALKVVNVKNDGTPEINYSAHAPKITSGSGHDSNYTNTGIIVDSIQTGTATKALGMSAVANGLRTVAAGDQSFTEGRETIASGLASHAEGLGSEVVKTINSRNNNILTANNVTGLAAGNVLKYINNAETYYIKIAGVDQTNNTITLESNDIVEELPTTGPYNVYLVKGIASGAYSHAEGNNTTASGERAHAEGYITVAASASSHAEGEQSTATNTAAHAEGKLTSASGGNSHAEGWKTEASSTAAHAEGYNTKATKTYAHAEGEETIADGSAAHAEGNLTEALGTKSHAEGYKTKATKNSAHAEGKGRDAEEAHDDVPAITEQYVEATEEASHAEGFATKASGEASHAEGYETEARGKGAHTEGYQTIAINHGTHAEGEGSKAEGSRSHAEGSYTYALGANSHAEGEGNFDYTKGIASGTDSHSEGRLTIACGYGSHAEGNETVAGDVEHVNSTNVSYYSHAEGNNTLAKGSQSHAEGLSTQALGDNSHASGEGTVANNASEFVCGKYNKYGNNDKRIFVVGNGTGNEANKRKNAFELKADSTSPLCKLNGDSVGINTLIGETGLDEIVKKIILDSFFPIGSIYTSTTSNDGECPIAAIGGTWTRIEDTFLYAAKDNDTTYGAGEIGGSKNAIVASHTHGTQTTIEGTTYGTTGSATTGITTTNNATTGIEETKPATTGITINERSDLTGVLDMIGFNSSEWILAEPPDHGILSRGAADSVKPAIQSNNSSHTREKIKIDASHDHGITDSGHTHEITDNGHAHGITDNGHTHPIAFAGEDRANKNMPPYLCVYMWKRTA